MARRIDQPVIRQKSFAVIKRYFHKRPLQKNASSPEPEDSPTSDDARRV